MNHCESLDKIDPLFLKRILYQNLPSFSGESQNSFKMVFFSHLLFLLPESCLSSSVGVENNAVNTNSNEEWNGDKDTKDDEVGG